MCWKLEILPVIRKNISCFIPKTGQLQALYLVEKGIHLGLASFLFVGPYCRKWCVSGGFPQCKQQGYFATKSFGLVCIHLNNTIPVTQCLTNVLVISCIVFELGKGQRAQNCCVLLKYFPERH